MLDPFVPQKDPASSIACLLYTITIKYLPMNRFSLIHLYTNRVKHSAKVCVNNSYTKLLSHIALGSEALSHRRRRWWCRAERSDFKSMAFKIYVMHARVSFSVKICCCRRIYVYVWCTATTRHTAIIIYFAVYSRQIYLSTRVLVCFRAYIVYRDRVCVKRLAYTTTGVFTLKRFSKKGNNNDNIRNRSPDTTTAAAAATDTTEAATID